MARSNKLSMIALLLVQVACTSTAFAAIGTAGSGISIEGQPGEFLTGGRRWLFQAPNHTVFVSTRALVPNDSGPSELIIGAFNANRSEYIDIEIGTTLTGASLRPGTYPTRLGYTEGNRGVELGISMIHRGCSQLEAPGQIVVSELDYQLPNDGDLTIRPHVTRLVANYRFQCSGPSSRVVVGAINFTADPLVDGLPPGNPNGGDDDDDDDGDGDGDGEDPGDPAPAPPALQLIVPGETLSMSNSASQTVPFSTAIDSTFNSDVRLSVSSNAPEHDELHVTLTPDRIAAPGVGAGTVTVRTGPMTFPRDYTVTLFAMSGESIAATSSFTVRVECTPPFILGVDQPQSVFGIAAGAQTSLEVKAGGSGPFLYQWYRGERGMTGSPVQAENNAKLILTARETGPYWVRVRNACGSVDSNAAMVVVTPPPATKTFFRRSSRSGG